MSSTSSSPDTVELSNRLAALALAISDAVAAATVAAAGRGAQAPAALASLRQSLGDATIEQLSRPLGLTHSATVRLVDRLVADGYVVRYSGSRDGRTVALRLTAAGAAAADGVLAARLATVEMSIGDLGEDDRVTLARIVDRLLVAVTRRRLQARSLGEPPTGGWLCRLCDFNACRRPAGSCPAAMTAGAFTPDDAADSLR